MCDNLILIWSTHYNTFARLYDGASLAITLLLQQSNVEKYYRKIKIEKCAHAEIDRSKFGKDGLEFVCKESKSQAYEVYEGRKKNLMWSLVMVR